MPADIKRFLGNRASNPWWVGMPDTVDLAEFYDEDVKSKVVRDKLFNYTVRLEQVHLPDGREVPGQFAPVCSDGFIIPATVGKSYRVIQPTVGLDIMDAMTHTGEVRLHTVGILNDRRTIWGLAQVGSQFRVNFEEIRKFALFWTAFDGSSRWNMKPVNECVVCANTLAAAKGEGTKNIISMSHSGDIEEKIENALEALGLLDKQFKESIGFIEQLQEDRMERAEMRTLVCQILTNLDDPEEAEKKVAESTGAQHTIYENKGGELMRCYDAGQGATQRGPTAWRAVSAVAEYIDWQRGRMKNWEQKYSRLTTAGLDSALFGDGERKKQRAVRLVTSRQVN